MGHNALGKHLGNDRLGPIRLVLFGHVGFLVVRGGKNLRVAVRDWRHILSIN
jgi:hypothetical protein